ncbi:thymidine kinase [Aeromonas phage AS-gz]|jgi:thymidine kinase|uniref:Thymidine kinase n=1 Tax=Aeromonas phage AS-gz TaxID=2026082 RepID=A0A223LG47_9CAUD|nr:thymidine kinase [Aeromonas phage AS-gz]ASU00731.1 thymidine kinase [Aeromonas phage AS-gz]
MKLHFHYAAMNSGKSTHLLQVAYNYAERGMNTIIVKPAIDTRDGNTVSSRIGLSAPAHMISYSDDLKALIEHEHSSKEIQCVLVDEAQFLTIEQVKQLSDVVDYLDIPVMCYGLMSDSNGFLFPASSELVLQAEELVEHKTICWCGSKATMNMRINENGEKIWGSQVSIGGNDRYISVCRRHWKEGKSSK